MATLSLLVATPSARAQDDEESARPVVDARLEGLTNSDQRDTVDVTKQLGAGGTGGYWVLFLFLAALTAGVLFKDAKRSHLD